MAFGKPTYGKKQEKKRFKLVDGKSNPFRILPPFGSLADKGHWSYFVRVHWGWGVPKDNNPEEIISRPFVCVQETRNRQVIQECPACNWIEENVNGPYEARKAECEQAGLTKEQTSDRLKVLVAARKKYNVDSGHVLNVMSLSGEVGLLKIPHKQKLTLDKCIKDECLEKMKIDPIDPDQGLFLNFCRTAPEDKNRVSDYIHSVSVFSEMQTVDVGGRRQQVPVPKEAPLSQEQLEAAEAHCWDLADTTIKLSVRDIQRLVETDNDPDVARAVFGKSQPDSRPQTSRPSIPEKRPAPAPSRTAAPPVADVEYEEGSYDDPPDTAPEPKPEPKPEPVPVQKFVKQASPPLPPQQPAAVDEEDEIAQLTKKLAAAKAAKLAAKQPPPAAVQSEPEDDFTATLNQLGLEPPKL